MPSDALILKQIWKFNHKDGGTMPIGSKLRYKVPDLADILAE